MKSTIIEEVFNVQVIKAYPETGQKFVFQILHPKYGQCILKIIKHMDERTIREIRIASDYSIPNIPMIYEYDSIDIKQNTLYYIIEEFIDGNTLREDLDKNNFSFEKSFNLLESLLNTAVALEKSQIVHRDIKPSNIICCENNLFYLIDFGIARILNSKSLTYTYDTVGPHTPGYGAPELFQYDKPNITIKADLFSIGIVAYEALFNEHPFLNGKEIDVDEIWIKIKKNDPKHQSLSGNGGKKLMQFLQTLMNKQISKRPPSAYVALEWFKRISNEIRG